MPLSAWRLLAYAAPGAGFGFVTLLVGTYYMKYATDVLAIPAAAMGAILLGLRAWDAIADPVAGYLSDRTRTRLGRRRPWLLAGALAVFAALARIGGSDDARAAAFAVAVVAGAVTAALLVLAGLAAREPAAHAGRGASRPLAAARDVLANPHARRLLAVSLLQQLAMGTVTTAAAYHAQYVLGDADAFAPLLGCFFVASLVSIPCWVRVARRAEKKPLLGAAMVATGALLAGMFAVGPGDRALFFALAAAGGFASGALDVLMPSLQADVIDWDELRTGERFPFVCFTAGALCFARFGLDRAGHARVVRELDAVRAYRRIEPSTPAITRVGASPWLAES